MSTRGTRQPLAVAAAAMRDAGLNGVQIADRLGISRSYAYELLNDPDGSRLKERKRRYDRECTDCGGRVNGTTPSKLAAEPRCDQCRRAYVTSNRYWTPERICEQIRAMASGDAAPSATEASKSSLLSMATAEYGSWSAAVAAAGLPARATGERRDPESWLRNLRASAYASRFWTEERTLNCIREASTDGIAPKMDQVSRGCHAAAVRDFGGWRKACEAAGLRWTSRAGRKPAGDA